MHVYDTLLIGSSYASFGYALARKNCLIAEEHHLCDTHFYLPLRSFSYREYTPKTEEGRRLFGFFSKLSLFKNGMQNTNGFECAFCQYISESDMMPLLNCRVIRTTEENGIRRVTLQTNEGLSTVNTQKIIDTRANGKHKRLTVLFTDRDIEKNAPLLCAAFPDAEIEPAFYEGRYALHFCADGFDENDIKLFVSQTWRALDIPARILSIAPIFSNIGTFEKICDSRYENPIEAFEIGYEMGATEQ